MSNSLPAMNWQLSSRVKELDHNCEVVNSILALLLLCYAL